MTPETKLKNAVLRHLKTVKDCWVYKSSDRFKSGIPDFLLCISGKFIAIELKARKAPSRSEPLQRHTLALIEKAGGVGRVCYSVEDVRQALNILAMSPADTKKA